MDRELKIILVFILCFIFLMSSFLAYYVVDDIYVKPIADSKANTYCQQNGFDQYKSYSRIGLWSKNPVGIKCEYAEKYTDLGVRVNAP